MLSNLNNEGIFKKAFADKSVIKSLVYDILGLNINIDNVEINKSIGLENIDAKARIDVAIECNGGRELVIIQHIEDDAALKRFLHYFSMIVAKSEEIMPERTVYALVLKTSPYDLREKNGSPLQDEVLLFDVNPTNLKGENYIINEHLLVCLNPNHPQAETPQSIRDWLDFIYQSIHQFRRPVINIHNAGIRQAAKNIHVDNLTTEERDSLQDGSAIEKAESENVKLDSRKEVAEKMLNAGIDISVIQQITGLTREDILNLK